MITKKYRMPLKKKYGELALVAGASEGLGEAFSRYLAGKGMDLILVARRKGPLDMLAAELTANFGVHAEVIVCDLSAGDAVQKIMESLGGRGINLLVYNAAISYIGPFETGSAEQNSKIACTNMITPMNLVHILGNDMLQKGKGAIILMASLAGFQGSGYLATYAASKAFTRVLAESLWYEWKSKGVDVMACCAGATATPNFTRSNPEKKSFFAPKVQKPDEVVLECMKHLGKRPSFIAGQGNKIASFILQKLIPRKMAITIMGDTTRRMYRL